MKVSKTSSKRFLTALLSSVIVTLSLAQTCAAQAVAGGARAPLMVREGDRCGYRDRAGLWVIPARFRVCTQFENGMAEVVSLDRKEDFYIDTSGRRIDGSNFASKHFSEGLIPVGIEKKYGFADESGRLVVFPAFDSVRDFSEGLAPVSAGGKWGFVDRTGSFRIAPQFDDADSFSEGLASVCFDTGEPKKPGEAVALEEPFSFEIKQKCGFIDRTGVIVIEPQFSMTGKFSEGLAPVYAGRYKRGLNALDPDAEASKWGYVDRTGRVVVPLKYAYASEFSEGLGVVQVGKKWGYIDASGKFVIPARFASADSFSGGLALVGVGEQTIYWPYKGLTVFELGLKGRYGYIDRTGKFVSDKLTWKGKWKR